MSRCQDEYSDDIERTTRRLDDAVDAMYMKKKEQLIISLLFSSPLFVFDVLVMLLDMMYVQQVPFTQPSSKHAGKKEKKKEKRKETYIRKPIC